MFVVSRLIKYSVITSKMAEKTIIKMKEKFTENRLVYVE